MGSGAETAVVTAWNRRLPAAVAGGGAAALATAEGWSWVHPVTDYAAPPVLALQGFLLGAALGAVIALLTRLLRVPPLYRGHWRWVLFGIAATAAFALCFFGLPHGDWTFARAAAPMRGWAVGVLAFACAGAALLLLSVPRARARLAAAALALVPLGLPFLTQHELRAAVELPAGLPRAVLLVTIDTLRADHLGCYGYARETSPALDALAKEGVLFERAFATMPTTDPSHVAILTGMPPRTSGVIKNGLSIARWGTASLASVLLERGYRTHAITSRSHLNPEALRISGFEGFSAPSERIGKAEAQETLQRARRWLARNGDSPAFLWVHFWDPHDPYDPPSEPERSLFVERYDGALKKRGEPGGPRGRGVTYTQEQVAYATGLYDGEIRHADARLGALIAAAREQFGRDQVLVVVTADHGETLGEMNDEEGFAFDHGLFLRRESLHVPLIAVWPGHLPAGQRVQAAISTGGLAASLAELCKVEFPAPELDGARITSFAPLFLAGDAAPAPGPVFAERRLFTEAKRDYALAPEIGVIDGTHMYVENPVRGNFLWDLAADPDLRTNLIEAQPERAQQMAALLRAFEEQYPKTQIDASSLDPDKVAALRKLGYVQ